MSNLAALYSKQRRYFESVELFIECYKLSTGIYGSDDPKTLTILKHLAQLSRKYQR